MKISVVCSSRNHPVYPHLVSWCADTSSGHQVELVERVAELTGGDLLFLISCSEIVKASTRNLYGTSLVIHASAVPRGRGWSPHIWQVVEGATEIPVTLMEVEDRVDSGKIWRQSTLRLKGHELYDEINDRLFAVELELMDYAVAQHGQVVPRPQPDEEPSYYRKRTPEDSRIDPNGSIASQFDLLRVADPGRFPAFFDLRGHRYRIVIEKMETEEE